MTEARRSRLPLSAIWRDSRVQPREAINLATVSDYALTMRKAPVYRDAGLAYASFPPVVVFHEVNDRGHDMYWLADGWHRLLAAEEAGLDSFEAEIHEGGVFDAALYAAGANAEHGLRRTRRDKHRAVRMLLDHPTVIREDWGNGRIAHAARVSDFLVKTVRHERERELGLPPSTERRGKDGKLYSLQLRIGKPQEAPGASENLAVQVEPGVAVISGQEAPVGRSEAFLHQCGTDGCDAVTTEPSWHCDRCGSHLPVREYPHGVECPVCVDDSATVPLVTVATVHHTAAPQTERNGTAQAPYTPGIMKPSDVVLAYERLRTAIDLIDTLAACRFEDVLAVSPEPDRFLARLRGARTTLHAMVERHDEVLTGAAR